MNETKKLCEIIWEIESKHNLLDLEILNAKLWILSRLRIYYAASMSRGIFSKPHNNDPTKTHIDPIGTTKRLLNALRSKPFITSNSKRTLILEHPRSITHNSLSIDPYTHDIKKNLHPASYILLSSNSSAYKTKTYDNSRRYTDWIDYTAGALRTFYILSKIKQKEKKEVKSLAKILELHFGNSNDYKAILLKILARFKIENAIYSAILSQAEIETLYLTVSYDNLSILTAAKAQGIKVVELQHGTLGKYHLGYSYSTADIDQLYIPDQFVAWSETWKALLPQPFSHIETSVRPYWLLEQTKQKQINTARKPGKIMIISQGALGDKIAEFILGYICELHDYEIIYKLHPGEYSQAHSYQHLNSLLQYPNVTLLRDCDLYKELSTCEFQLGVFSTALYEGIELGTKTVLLPLPGSELMDDLIERKAAITFDQFVAMRSLSKT